MRTLIIALGFAALAANPALAQTGVSSGSATTTAAATTGGTTTTGTTTTGTTTTGTTTATLPSTSVGAEPVTAAPASASGATGTSTTVSGGATTGFGTNVETDPDAAAPGNSFGPGGPFANDNTNAALGTSVPEGTVSVIGGGTTGAQVIGVPSTAQSQQVTISGSTQTPLFDQVAREGREKEASRRARGEEPRIYGIAPNTERDLTWQMPDDPIIRY